ncbi:MAG: aminotransferase class I/II-fold pyridoxal phosphate-dependent enzyme, partial [Candidatus Thermoplasmatota archaeon]|nr:aminotransferase class I/II-fold pyridoxal phosphate-dependent enzyme [Candidatus Thermoplasmatota archaeon]
EMVGYPQGAGGLLTSGGSMANLIALVTARHEHLGEAFLDGVIYTSDQTHNSVLKAARFAGIPRGNVREIATDDRFRLRPDALEAAIQADLDQGLEPFFINANAGTTNTGAVDPLEAIADIAEAHGLWLHADAAYGGFFVLTDEGREALNGMARADSITLDPHKGLFLPYGTGSLIVRDPLTLERAHAEEADYLPDTAGVDLVDYGRISPELSRDFRGLRVWLPLKLHGIAPFRAQLEEKLELASRASQGLSGIEHVSILAEPQLSTLAFRLEPPGMEGEALDALNHAWLDAINRDGRVMLSGTRLEGRFALRVSIVSFRTHQEQVDALLDAAKTTASELVAKHTS